MAPSETNSEGFKLVVKPQTSKKAKTTPFGALRVKLAVEMELQVIFQLPKHPCKDFQPVQQMKQFVSKLLKHDILIAFHSLENNEDLLYPQYNSFPLKRKKFTPYFFI